MKIGLICLIAVLHNFSAGYNCGVIAGAMNSLKTEFPMTSAQQGGIVSCILLGALVGSQVASFFFERFGRRDSIIYSNLIYIIGCIGMSLSVNLTMLIFFRTFAGLGVGVANVFTSTYIAEIAPPSIRGRYGSFVPFSFTTGTIISNCMYLAFFGQWRLMFGFGIIPAILQMIFGICFLPESPRYLIFKGHLEKAKIIMQSLLVDSVDDEIDEQIEGIIQQMEHTRSGDSNRQSKYTILCSKQLRKPLVISVGLMLLQQATGVNVVTYYGPVILVQVGFSQSNAIYIVIAQGFFQLISTFIMTMVIDKMGRKPLLYIGLSGMITSLGLLCLAFSDPNSVPISQDVLHILAIIGMLLFRCAFSVSMGPIAFVITSEVFPGYTRSLGVGTAWASNWSSNFLISVTFPIIVQIIGQQIAFSFYLIMCIVSVVFICCYVPETKGKTLEQLEIELSNENPLLKPNTAHPLVELEINNDKVNNKTEITSVKPE